MPKSPQSPGHLRVSPGPQIWRQGLGLACGRSICQSSPAAGSPRAGCGLVILNSAATPGLPPLPPGSLPFPTPSFHLTIKICRAFFFPKRFNACFPLAHLCLIREAAITISVPKQESPKKPPTAGPSQSQGEKLPRNQEGKGQVLFPELGSRALGSGSRGGFLNLGVAQGGRSPVLPRALVLLRPQRLLSLPSRGLPAPRASEAPGHTAGGMVNKAPPRSPRYPRDRSSARVGPARVDSEKHSHSWTN